MADPEKVKTIQESWLAVKDGAGSAIKDPSLLGSFSKEVVGFGASAFKFFGIIENANDLRKLWRDDEEKKKHSLLGKIGLSIVYAGNIAASSIAAAVVLGASVVAAPIAAAIVSGAGLVKNTADYIKENEYHKKLTKEAQELETELAKANVSFEANTALYHDLENAKSSISQLKNQKTELSKEIENLQKLQKKDKLPDVEELADEFSQKAKKNQVLANYLHKHKGETTEQSLKRVQDRQAKYTDARNHLLNKMKSANPTSQAKLSEQLMVVEAKLEKYAFLKNHHEKIQKLENLLKEVQTQIDNLDTKYNKEPYKEGTVDRNLEKEYLNLRHEELTLEIANLKNPDIRAEKANANKEAADKLSENGQDPSERMARIKETLIEQLTQQSTKVQAKIDNQTSKLESKEKFASLFTKDPKQAMVGDAKAVFNKSLDLIDKRNQIKLTSIDRKKKGKGIGFAAAGLGLAVCVCVPALWPVAGILTLVGAGVGVAWGISTLWDKYQRSKTEKVNIKEKGAESEKLLTQLDDFIQKKADKAQAKKAEVTQNLVSSLDDARSKLNGISEVPHHDHVGQSNNGVLHHHKKDRQEVEAAIRTTPTPTVEVTPPKTSVASIKK